jgi:hypothetical protein
VDSANTQSDSSNEGNGKSSNGGSSDNRVGSGSSGSGSSGSSHHGRSSLHQSKPSIRSDTLVNSSNNESINGSSDKTWSTMSPYTSSSNSGNNSEWSSGTSFKQKESQSSRSMQKPYLFQPAQNIEKDPVWMNGKLPIKVMQVCIFLFYHFLLLNTKLNLA